MGDGVLQMAKAFWSDTYGEAAICEDILVWSTWHRAPILLQVILANNAISWNDDAPPSSGATCGVSTTWR